jgi:hypothetical protein
VCKQQGTRTYRYPLPVTHKMWKNEKLKKMKNAETPPDRGMVRGFRFFVFPFFQPTENKFDETFAARAECRVPYGCESYVEMFRNEPKEGHKA